MIEKTFRYFHTLRHLKPTQLAFQVIRRLTRPKISKRRVPVARRPGVAIKPVIGRTMTCPDAFAFRFLNEERHFSPEAIDWQPASAGKLWCYNIHYFDYLQETERSFESCRILIDSWIASNPPGTVNAWEPFPLSLRIVNWIKYFLVSGIHAANDLPWLESLYDQALWLEQSIEYHLLANHYFKNGKALIFVGLFYSGRDADRWLRKGLKIVGSELGEQILSDGGHFERSPMYHAMILEDCLDLLNICSERSEREVGILVGQLREVIPRMLSFLHGMTHPDGEIALFNDAAIGIESNYRQLAEYWARLTATGNTDPDVQVLAFPESGFFVMTPRAGDRLIVDCGPVGPDYQPGHAHCDLLSFELSLGGRRIIVDSGCGQYLAGELRTYQRGNAGHNSVTIDNQNQSEVWGAHRCARRARPLNSSFDRQLDGTLYFSCSHDGYCRLPGHPLHHRTITWRHRCITITDCVTGKGVHVIELRLHLNPELTVELIAGSAAVRDGSQKLATIAAVDGCHIDITKGIYSPQFGTAIPAPVLLLSYPAHLLPFHGGWQIQIP